MPGRSTPLRGELDRHLDAHRHALHDLGEVAGRVVRRQQREHRAGGRRDAHHGAVDRVAAQRVDRDRHRLAGLQLAELRLLEVRVDIDRIERHQAREPLARLHVVADLHGAIADDAVDRRLMTVNERSRSALASAVFNSFSVRAASSCCALSTSTFASAASIAACAPCTAAAVCAVGLRGLERLLAGVVARRERLLALELELGARGGRLRGGELRLGLLDRGLLRLDLLADAIDGRLLGRDLVARGSRPRADSRRRRSSRSRRRRARARCRRPAPPRHSPRPWRRAWCSSRPHRRRRSRPDSARRSTSDGRTSRRAPSAASSAAGSDRLAVQPLRLCGGAGGGFAAGTIDGPGRPGSVRLYRAAGVGATGESAPLAAGVAASFFCQAGRPMAGGRSIGRIAIPIHGGVPSSLAPAPSACKY